MRVFLDTNVLVAAFATRGLCADVFRLVLAEHELLVSAALIEAAPALMRAPRVPGAWNPMKITVLLGSGRRRIR